MRFFKKLPLKEGMPYYLHKKMENTWQAGKKLNHGLSIVE